VTPAWSLRPSPAVPADPFVERYLRRNLLALGADLGLFLVGLSFASPSTILPAFVASLGAPNLVVGAIPAVMTAGWFLPSLFVAGHTQALSRKLPFVLRYTVWERLPLLGLALVAFVLAARAPGLAQALVLLMLLALTAVGGALMPAWMDVVGRCIPTTLRGRFFAAASVLGSLGGLGAGGAATWILARLPPSAGYGVCFLGGAVFMALGFAALAAAREPPGPPGANAVPLGAHLRAIPDLLRRDRNLGWFLLARAAAAFGTMASGFYTVYALRAWGAPVWAVGVFTTALLLGQTAGNFALGWLADRAGHRLVIIAGVGGSIAANLLALFAPSLETFILVFVLYGGQVAAVNVSWLPVLLEFAPRVDLRPTYVGLGNTALAPASFAAPLLAAVAIDTFGFRATFAASAVCGLLAFGLLARRVRDPRYAPAPGVL
jgi:MFS family permease